MPHRTPSSMRRYLSTPPAHSAICMMRKRGVLTEVLAGVAMEVAIEVLIGVAIAVAIGVLIGIAMGVLVGASSGEFMGICCVIFPILGLVLPCKDSAFW